MNKLPNNLFRNGFNNEASGPVNIDSVNIVRKFIGDNFEKANTINTKIGSCALKSIFERNQPVTGYVSDGDFIAAMILEGYSYKMENKKSSSAFFNLSKKSVKKFYSEDGK